MTSFLKKHKMLILYLLFAASLAFGIRYLWSIAYICGKQKGEYEGYDYSLVYLIDLADAIRDKHNCSPEQIIQMLDAHIYKSRKILTHDYEKWALEEHILSSISNFKKYAKKNSIDTSKLALAPNSDEYSSALDKVNDDCACFMSNFLYALNQDEQYKAVALIGDSLISNNLANLWCYRIIGEANYRMGNLQESVKVLEASLNMPPLVSDIYSPCSNPREIEELLRATTEFNLHEVYKSMDSLNESDEYMQKAKTKLQTYFKDKYSDDMAERFFKKSSWQ